MDKDRCSDSEPVTTRSAAVGLEDDNIARMDEIRKTGYFDDEPGYFDDEAEDYSYSKELERARLVLPAWFISRMMDDEWSFGLMLVSGVVLAISNIRDVRLAADGNIWLDVCMIEDVDFFQKRCWTGLTIVGAPTSRLIATINAAHVVWAFELADT